MKVTPTKPQRNAIAVILRRPGTPNEFLAVKRPNEGNDLEGFWGLPATFMRDGELPEDAARRVCREKLACDAVPLHLVGTMFQKRPGYDMVFMDVEMLLVGPHEPDVSKATTESTVYVDQQWTTDPAILQDAAAHGSCCSTIFLTTQGVIDKTDWMTDLEASSVVS